LAFDFEKLSNIVANIYQDGDGPYSLEDVLMVFRWYFGSYERWTGHSHPPIKTQQILRIIQEMPWLRPEDKGIRYASIDPEFYQDMIDQHFKTKYRNCDYNINHFFSGRVRELRWLEIY